MSLFSVSKFREQFPILQSVTPAHQLVYFDNAATTQKHITVIRSSQNFYLESNANVHRASHYLSAKATKSYEQVRSQVKRFLNASSEKEIIWTKGTTEAINLVAQSYAIKNLKAGDDIVISQAEHHANIVPWQHVVEQTGATLNVLGLDIDGRIDLKAASTTITERCKLLAINHISNVIGKVNPVKELIALAKAYGAVTLIDGAQAVAHLPVDVQDLGCDFYVFSAHKTYGPTGIGVLYGKQQILEQMPPYQFGGEMIKKVSFTGTTFNELPHKFEAGTPNIVGVIGLGQCINLLQSSQIKELHQHEQQLCHYLFSALNKMDNIHLIYPSCPDVAIFTLKMADVHHHDLAAYLDSKGIAVRSGHHCAMPLMDLLGLEGAVRISLTSYNTCDEIDYLIEQLQAYDQQDNQQNSQQESQAGTSLNAVIDFISQQQILALFAKATSWDLKHRQIMLLAKQLARKDKSLRLESELISGCESKAWLAAAIAPETGVFTFSADSDAKVIRGLMVIVLSVYQGRTAQQIIDFDIEEYFAHLGLMQHLSPSRGNGIKAIVERIVQLAAAQL
ncbi:SufS family cysteine desulfurase [Colwelliaceae bacterium BS250]